LFQNHPSNVTALTISALVKLAGQGMRPTKFHRVSANVLMQLNMKRIFAQLFPCLSSCFKIQVLMLRWWPILRVASSPKTVSSTRITQMHGSHEQLQGRRFRKASRKIGPTKFKRPLPLPSPSCLSMVRSLYTAMGHGITGKNSGTPYHYCNRHSIPRQIPQY
jgi:hypothetical protein